MIGSPLANKLVAGPRSLNLCHLHDLFQTTADTASAWLKAEYEINIPISAGMWGGAYLVADELGVSRTNVVRLYSLVNLPQNTPLDDKENFEKFVVLYRETLQSNFKVHGLDFVDPHWGEAIPYTNEIRPTTTLQMWDATERVKFVRAFFVWNTATWAESVIYDAVRNVKVIKELLDLERRPSKKSEDELKFMLQDAMIIYFTLKPALTPDFREHAQPIVDKLFKHFIEGLHDGEVIEDLSRKVYANALVYGYEEILEPAYKKDGLDIHEIEKWPVEKINWAPEELKEKLVPHLEGKFATYRENLAKPRH